MIRRFALDPKETAELLARGNAAGDGATFVAVPESTKDGTGMTFRFDFRAAALANAKDEDCEPGVNSAHVCPGPLCPTP